MKNYEIQDLNAQKSLTRLALSKKMISQEEYDKKISGLELEEKAILRDKQKQSEKISLAKKRLKDLVLT